MSRSIWISADTKCRPSPSSTASLMYRLSFSAFSISEGVMFLPPLVMRMAFLRSTICTSCVAGSSSTTSPVRSQPSSKAAAVAASSNR